VNGLFVGVDVGTQGAKALVIDPERGAVVGRAAESYGLIEGLAAGAAEQHPETWARAVGSVLHELWGTCDARRVAAIGVSGQQHGFVPLDSGYEVIRPAKLWCDTETVAEAAELSAAMGRSLPTGFTASKILWLARHEPDSFARLRHVALPHDWINLLLCGELVMECGDASGTGFFDSSKRCFDTARAEQVVAGLGAMLPPLVDAGVSIGRVSEKAAVRFGLPEGALVATGGGDNMMSAIGSGASVAGVVVLSLGTSGTVFAYSGTPVVDPAGLVASFCDSTGAWLPLLCVMNLTEVVDEVCVAFGLGHRELEQRAASVAPGADGLRLLPFLRGERVPDLPRATGSLHGMRPGWLDPARLYRAALEGTTMNLAWGVRRLRELGVHVDQLRLVGGAARNRLWRSIIADVHDVPVVAMAEPESAALGGALQALWTWHRARGTETSLEALAAPFVHTIDAPLEPDADRVARYAEVFASWSEHLRREWGCEAPA